MPHMTAFARNQWFLAKAVNEISSTSITFTAS